MATHSHLLERVPIGPMRVSVLVAGWHPPPDGCVDGLRRQVIDVGDLVDLVDCQHNNSIDPARSVLIVWMPDGLDASSCRQIISWVRTSSQPIAVLGVGVKATTADSETALAAGFDDCVAGRASVREIAARVRALHRRVRRMPAVPQERQRYGRFVLDPIGHQVWVDGRAVSLSATELRVMTALVDARGRALSRARILDAAWGDSNLDVSERAVDNVVLRLRRKLDHPELIETVRGVGFRLAAS